MFGLVKYHHQWLPHRGLWLLQSPSELESYLASLRSGEPFRVPLIRGLPSGLGPGEGGGDLPFAVGGAHVHEAYLRALSSALIACVSNPRGGGKGAASELRLLLHGSPGRGSESSEALASLLRADAPLAALEVEGCDWSPDDLGVLTESLWRNKALRKLALRDSVRRWGAEGGAHLAVLLRAMVRCRRSFGREEII